uniref:Macrophage mannose receptor 1-like n=1 Tax=Gouania willdenowi TaxID=441366 RepID=A0A8C5GCV9_GOUWI
TSTYCIVFLTDLVENKMQQSDHKTELLNATGFCLVKKSNRCLDLRWTTGNRIFVTSSRKCLGAQGKSVGSEVSLYDCDDRSDLQKWECKNGTLLALKGQELYIQVKADESIALSKTVGPNNLLTISGTASGACTRTHRELYTIEGNAFGKICMFPFMYKDRWFGDCITYDSSSKRLWCAVETKYEREQWGYCPTSSREHWAKNLVTGAYYQINSQSALNWSQAQTSCKQQMASLVSITDPNEQAYITALLGSGKKKLWLGLVMDPEHGWQWTNAKPFRYLRWDTGNPLPNPGHNCAVLDSSGQYLWQSSTCSKKMGYICYKDGTPPTPPIYFEQGFCASPWIPYNGHCFHLHRTLQTWSDAQRECRKEGGDLVSIRNVEDHSFVISQLGYASTDELWIGLNDRKTEGLFEWSDHSAVTFTSWQYGAPAVSTDTEDCVLITGENGNWADRTCDEKHGFICMKQSSTESTGEEVEMDLGCKMGWKRHGSYCYFVGTETKTFDEAKEDCKTSGSYLADVSNGVDNAFLVSLVGWRPERHFWIGLSNMENMDLFKWTNSDTVKFTHWNAQMPGYEQGCVAMTSGLLAGLWDLLPCSNKTKYICKHLAEGAVSTVPPPTQTPPKCAEGWIKLQSRNACYKFFTGPRSQEKTWFEAKDFCRAIGGDLLSIHSSVEQAVGRYSRHNYRKQFGGRAWIGLHVPESGTGYVWSDGTPEGEPNNFNNAESCVEFTIYNWDDSGSWNDAHCETYNDWLCQIRADFNTTADGWLEWRGNQYYINRYSKSMEEARHFCQQKHGDLATINSKEENTFLWKQYRTDTHSHHLSLSKLIHCVCVSRWMDGTPMSFQRWDENQPNSNVFDENCVSMSYHMGFWSTCNCGKELQSFCKRRSSPPVNTTVAPTVPPKGGCPIKWVKFGSKCYSIVSDRKITWEDARKQCIMMRGLLVSIPSRSVQAFLVTQLIDALNTDLWIGLNSLKQDGYYWTDGKSRQFTNWGYSVSTHNIDNSVPSCLKYSLTSILLCKSLCCFSSFGLIKFSFGSLETSAQARDIPADSETIDPNIYTRLGNDSIKVVTQNLTWDEAKKRCDGEKANLASLRNEWTRAHIELLVLNLKAPLWIGLNKKKTGDYFRYVDGWHLNFANWAPGEPGREKPCVYLDVSGKWMTDFCNQTMYSVCMQSTDVPPTESTSFPGNCPTDTEVDYQQSYTWLPFRGHCYLFVHDEIEWADAASSCVRHGGFLASIEDPDEQKFIQSNIEAFQGSQRTWLWLDKTVVDYTNWAPEEPDSDYGSVRTTDGAWSSVTPPSSKFPFIRKPLRHLSFVDSAEPQIDHNSRGRVHTTFVVVLIITITSTLMVVGFLLYKKSPRLLPTFENPLYFNSEHSPPDVVDTNKMIEIAENSEPVPTPILTL